jgi:membrane protein
MMSPMRQDAAGPSAVPVKAREKASRWPGQPAVRGPFRVVVSTVRLYVEDNCGTYAAAIAYYAIFSLVPLSLVVLSIFGLVVDQARIERYVFDQIPLEQTETVRGDVQEIVRRARDVSVAGLGAGVLILLWSSSGIFSAVRRGLNATSHRRRRRPYWHGKLLDLALVPSVGVLILISLGLTAMLQLAVERAGAVGPAELTANLAFQVGSIVLAALFSFTMFALLYRYVPSARPGWREALFGSGLATILFELTKHLYAAFFALTPFQRDTALYAGFGTAMAFLLWMFVNASILLLGAEFGRAVTAASQPDPALPLVGETP